MVEEAKTIRQGVYNNDYFSGAQVAIYIGDVLVDEITSFSVAVSQSKTPLYGYASRLYDGVSEGHVIVQGQFSINFKEAGYLWLILNRYRTLISGKNSFLSVGSDQAPEGTGEYVVDQTIEQIVNGEADTKPEFLKQINEIASRAALASSHSSLAGFSSSNRSTGSIGQAENIFEAFENHVWGPKARGTGVTSAGLDIPDITSNRRADEPALNPFDIYIAFGDFISDDRIHHTVQKVIGVHILETSKQIVIDGQPVSEVYNFIAKDII